MALVLCTGKDEALLKTRKLILEQAGHTVLVASDERELRRICDQHPIEVAVIGQTVTPRVKTRIADIVRQQCRGAKILELVLVHQSRALADADGWLEVPVDVPEQLAQKVRELAENGGSGRVSA